MARFGSVMFVAGMTLVGQSFAQDPPADSEERIMEEIVVTGSRLPQRDYDALSPIATIDREALLFASQPTLEETLNQMPQVAPDYGRSSNNPGDGTARINLRAMGAGRTLVLLNGRRVSPSGVGGEVNANNLPQALVERVEVITGGATTVYGSDAIAGVVNFITRDDFEGFGLDTSFYVTEEGDSRINDTNLSFGWDLGGNGNLAMYAGYYDREALFASEREFTSVSWFDWWDGTIRQGGSSTTPAGVVFNPQVDFGGGFARTTFDANGDPRPYDFDTDFYNYAPVNYLQIPLQRSSAGLLFRYDLTDRLETYAELSYVRNEVRQTLAPAPAIGFFAINTDNPALTPAAQEVFANNFFPIGPGLVGMVLGRRLSELGPRIIERDSDFLRLAAGLRGDLGGGWDFDAWVIYSDQDEDRFFANSASFARFQQGLLVDPATGQCFDSSGGCVPVNPFGEGNISTAALDFLRYGPFRNVSSREQKVVSGFVRGAPFSSWAGEVNLAVGLEWREDSGSYRADDALFTDDALGYRADASVNGSESVYEIYSEATIPLAEGASWAEYLGLEVGGRYSDYEFAGSVDTWKLGLEWQLPAPVKFRAMLQRSVRAPNLLEAFQEQGRESGSFAGTFGNGDPCSAHLDPVGNGLAGACLATGLPESELGTWMATPGAPADFIFGGNPELEPESADTLTAGVVMNFDWLNGMQLSVDYFRLEVEDTIGDLDVKLACFDLANTGHLFCDSLTRDPVTLDVVEVYAPKVNRGRYSVEGIDTQINLEAELPDSLAIGGSSAGLGLNLVWTHTLESSYQETPFGTVFDCAGTFSWPCSLTRDTFMYPKNRLSAVMRYYSGPFDARLTWRWIDSMINGLLPHGEKVGLGNIIISVPEVNAKSYLDLALGYRFSDHVSARLVIANLTETRPPFMADYAFSNNTDSTVYDVFGRAYTLSLSFEY
jgi:outer membrane receptor protein involved in Fe transport